MAGCCLLTVVVVRLVECALPAGGLAHPADVEQAGAEQAVGVDRAVGRPDDFGRGLECSQQVLDAVQLRVVQQVTLVQQEHVGVLDLFDQQVRERPGAVLVGAALRHRVRHGAVGVSRPGIRRRGGVVRRLAGDERLEEQVCVHDGRQRVHLVQRGGLRPGGEQAGDGGRFGDARRLHDEVCELSLAREADDLGVQVVLQATADTAVRQFRHAVVHVEFRPVCDEVRIDVYLADVVDQHGDLAAGVPEQVVDERRLARAETAREDGHRNRVVHVGRTGPSRLKSPSSGDRPPSQSEARRGPSASQTTYRPPVVRRSRPVRRSRSHRRSTATGWASRRRASSGAVAGPVSASSSGTESRGSLTGRVRCVGTFRTSPQPCGFSSRAVVQPRGRSNRTSCRDPSATASDDHSYLPLSVELRS